MKLEPWQAELLIKMEEGPLTMSMGRQTGKSSWYSTLKAFMEQPTKRFQLASHPYGGQSCMLMIEDYMWWTDNEREILNWMAENLPRGIEHQQGMVLTFDTDKQRMMFMLRWG